MLVFHNFLEDIDEVPVDQEKECVNDKPDDVQNYHKHFQKQILAIVNLVVIGNYDQAQLCQADESVKGEVKYLVLGHLPLNQFFFHQVVHHEDLVGGQNVDYQIVEYKEEDVILDDEYSLDE